MKTTTISQSVITDSADPIFTFTEDDERLIVETGVTLSNRGDFVISAWDQPLSNLHAYIDGTVQSHTQGWAPVMAWPSSMHLTVGANGELLGRVAAFEASGSSSLVNSGLLHASVGSGANFNDGTSSVVMNDGTIFGEGGGVIFGINEEPYTGKSAVLTNHGRVEAGAADNFGCHGVFSVVESTTLNNSGSILANARSAAGIMSRDMYVEPGIEDRTLLLDNSGTVESTRYIGVVASEWQETTIMNTGTISGAMGSLRLSSAADSVTNDGILEGRAVLRGGDDTYSGEDGRVLGEVWGQGGSDLLVGGAFADTLSGGSGNDTITGGGANDVLTGAAGADVISGGAGNDVFRFVVASHTTGDQIVASGGVAAFQGVGTAGGDRINVSAIDANAGLAGNQQFSFGTSQGVGDLWAVDLGDATHIRGNTGGDASPELDLAILDGPGIAASDYAAIDFIL